MLKNKSVLQVIREGRVYELSLSNESPLGECFDVLSEMQGYIIKRIQESQEIKEEPKQENL